MTVQNSILSIENRALFNKNSASDGAAIFSVNSSSSLSGKIDFINNEADTTKQIPLVEPSLLIFPTCLVMGI